MARTPTVDAYTEGASLEDLPCWITANRALVDLTTGHTYSLKVCNRTAAGVLATLFTKTTGFTGAAGSGTPKSGTPNLTVAWATSGEITTLAPGVTYECFLEITRTADNKKRTRTFYLPIGDGP